MKGVIVQVGEPKSIVLFNNGKIAAIPTPTDCRVGMVVTVKFNNRLKIAALALAAVLLVAAGVFIGVSLAKGKPDNPQPAAVIEEGTYDWQSGREKMQELKHKYSD
jgi:hypothetical protein